MKKILSAAILTVLLTGCSISLGTPQNPENSPILTENVQKELAANEDVVEGAKVKYSLVYDKDKWVKETPEVGSPAEYSFAHVDGDVWGMVIAERLSVSLDDLKQIALTNAQSVAPDAKITFEEMRKVNGIDVLAMKIEGTTTGIKFLYYGYYYTGKTTSIQAVTFTSQELFPQYEEELTKFLNGLTVDASTVLTKEDLAAEKDLPVENVESLVDGIVEGSKVPYSIKYDSAKWLIEKGTPGGVSEYSFSHVDGDLYAMVIPERIKVDIADLKQLALDNAKAAAPDAKITFEETRKVNGKDLLVLQLTGTIQGINFKYYGYYYAGKSGTIQFLTYTSPELFDQYKTDIEDLLNGFEVTE